MAKKYDIGERPKYLSIDYRDLFGNNYVVRVQRYGKHFVVWAGKDLEVGKRVARKVNKLMDKGFSYFLDWYDYDMEGWLRKCGIKSK